MSGTQVWERACACGGTVRALPDDPTPGVREHQRSTLHARYRARYHAEPPMDPTADSIRVDLSADAPVRPVRRRRGRMAVR